MPSKKSFPPIKRVTDKMPVVARLDMLGERARELADLKARGAPPSQPEHPTLASIDARFDAVFDHLNTIEGLIRERINHIEDRVDGHDEQLSKHIDRLDGHDHEIGDLKVAAKNHEQRIVDLERKRHG